MCPLVVPMTNKSAVLSQKAAPVTAGPRSWESKSMTEDESDTDRSDVACPECGREFADSHAMKSHYGQMHDGSLGGVDLTCEWCGAKYNVTPARSDTSRFCSHDCRLEGLHDNMSGEDNPAWKGEEGDCICEQCGNEYRKKPYDAQNSRFCSRECLNEWFTEENTGVNNHFWRGGMVELVCEWCNDSYHVKQSRAETGRFCSGDCRLEWWSMHLSENYDQSGENNHRWKGGTSPYGEGWNKKKKETVRKRDGRKCKLCGLTGKEHVESYDCHLHVHHIIPARTITDPERRNHPSNLITLCADCHKTAEKMTPLLPESDGE